LDRLEAADRPAELDAELGVLDAHVEAPLRASHLLGSERNGRELEGLLHYGAGLAPGADESSRYRVEGQRRLLAGHVGRLQPPAGEPRRTTVDREQRGTFLGLGDHEDEIRDRAIEDEGLATVEHVPVAGTARPGLQTVGAPASVVLRHRER